MEQAKSTYSPLWNAFEKQIKTIEDQGQKQVKALEDLKPKKQTKPIEDKSNNQSKATAIFNDLLNKRKKIMSELYAKQDDTKGTELKILTLKQMLQILPIAPALTRFIEWDPAITQVYWMRSDKLFILCINQNKLLKKYTII